MDVKIMIPVLVLTTMRVEEVEGIVAVEEEVVVVNVITAIVLAMWPAIVPKLVDILVQDIEEAAVVDVVAVILEDRPTESCVISVADIIILLGTVKQMRSNATVVESSAISRGIAHRQEITSRHLQTMLRPKSKINR